MDCYSRRIVGWAIADHMRKELVIDALTMAVARRRPDAGVLHHSDHGSQYTSLLFTTRQHRTRGWVGASQKRAPGDRVRVAWRISLQSRASRGWATGESPESTPRRADSAMLPRHKETG